MFTLENTEGFPQRDLDTMNRIVGQIRSEHDLPLYLAEEAVGQTFDPDTPFSSNEWRALARLNLA